ncbi:response regulator transcription factor [Paenibacillus senegalensis]|uniref:response regulator transcription factor n=1 Tax=Paenibacillus senegalensis TaxID=1465766 RepID=UPI00028A090F|nr:response regulator transcription factor [Paenibacillus senegalensis]
MAPTMQRILLVDDEQQVLEFIQPFLEEEGYVVMTASNGEEALALAQAQSPDLAILDWMLPGMNGIELCIRLRAWKPIGIIMVTARAEEHDKLTGLEMGADDYIVKPFSLRELAARIRSVLRRTQDSGTSASQLMVRGELKISPEELRIWRSQQEIQLTPTEFKLLMTMAAKPGIVYSRMQLLDMVQDDFLNDERTIDAHISRLRKKIELDPSRPHYIQTVYGFGYRFNGEI